MFSDEFDSLGLFMAGLQLL